MLAALWVSEVLASHIKSNKLLHLYTILRITRKFYKRYEITFIGLIQEETFMMTLPIYWYYFSTHDPYRTANSMETLVS